MRRRAYYILSHRALSRADLLDAIASGADDELRPIAFRALAELIECGAIAYSPHNSVLYVRPL